MPGNELGKGGTLVARLRLVADDEGFTGTIALADKSVRRATGSVRRYATGARGASAANRALGRSFLEAHGHHLKYGGWAAAAYGVQRYGRAVAQTADEFTNLTNRLRTVAQSDRHVADLRERIYESAQRTRSEFGATASFYSRLAASADQLNLSEEKLLLVTTTLNRQIQLGGSTATEASAGLIQFGQGLASGRLNGDELRSVLEQLLGVSQGLVRGFERLRARGEIDFKVTRGNIRQLAAEGRLTADLLIKAILEVADETEARYGRLTATIAQNTTVLGNAATRLIGGTDAALGASAALGRGLQGLASTIEDIDVGEFADDLRSVGSAALWLGGAMLVRVTHRVVQYAGAAARGAYASRRLADAQLSVARQTLRADRALKASTVSMIAAIGRTRALTRATFFVGRSLAVLSGPAGLLLLGAYAAYEFATANDRVRDSVDDLPDDIDAYAESIRKLGAAESRIEARERRSDLSSAVAARIEAEKRLRRLREEGVETTIGFEPDRVQEDKLVPVRGRREATAAELEAATAAVEAAERRVEELNARYRVARDQALGADGAGAAAYEPSQQLQEVLRKVQGEREALAGELDKALRTLAQEEGLDPKVRAAHEERVKAYFDEKTAVLDAKEAQEARRRETETGLPALAELSARARESATAAKQGATAWEEWNREARLREETMRRYPQASAETVDGIVAETLALERQERALRARDELVASLATPRQRRERRIADLENLAGDEGEDPRHRAAAGAEIARLRGEAELEAKREAWERERLARQGFHTLLEEEEHAHQERMLAYATRYSPLIQDVALQAREAVRQQGIGAVQAWLGTAQTLLAEGARTSKRTFRLWEHLREAGAGRRDRRGHRLAGGDDRQPGAAHGVPPRRRGGPADVLPRPGRPARRRRRIRRARGDHAAAPATERAAGRGERGRRPALRGVRPAGAHRGSRRRRRRRRDGGIHPPRAGVAVPLPAPRRTAPGRRAQPHLDGVTTWRCGRSPTCLRARAAAPRRTCACCGCGSATATSRCRGTASTACAGRTGPRGRASRSRTPSASGRSWPSTPARRPSTSPCPARRRRRSGAASGGRDPPGAAPRGAT